jgi:hypothetical protein
MLALSNLVDGVFPIVEAQRKPSAYVNQVLKALSGPSSSRPSRKRSRAEPAVDDEAQEPAGKRRRTSHGLRRGPALKAAESPQVDLQWLAQRAGWDLDKVNAMFAYLCGSTRGDGRVGRVLSGWLDANRGGRCPALEDVPVDERTVFTWYVEQLMPTPAVEQKVKIGGTMALLLHFPAVRSKYPRCLLVEKMLSCGEVTTETVERWSVMVEKAFVAVNAPHTSLAGTASTHDATVRYAPIVC